MKYRVLLLLLTLLVLVPGGNSYGSVFVPHPIPQDAPVITPGMALQGEITGAEGEYYRFNIEQNRRYFILVFTESIGNVEALLLTSRGFTLAQNSNPPAWTQMGHGSFIPVEILPPDVPATPGAPITQIHSSKNSLFILIRWGGKYLPDTGTFIIQLVEDEVPYENGSYEYAGGRDTWPFAEGIKAPHPIPESVIPITPGTALRGEITQELTQKYYYFNVGENRRYFVLVFTETIGDVEAYLLTPEGLTVGENNDAPGWTQMGYGSFMAVEVLPEGVPFTNNSPIMQIHADWDSLFFMVKWGGNHLPDTGTFIVEVVEDEVPYENGSYKYAGGRDTWPFQGIILPPAYVYNEGETGETSSEITINGENYYYINPSLDESLSNIEITLNGSAGAPAEWYLAIRTFRDGKFTQYYMDENWKWVSFETIDQVRPFLTAVKDINQAVVNIPSILLYPGEYEFYFIADTCLNRVPDRLTTLATAELVREK